MRNAPQTFANHRALPSNLYVIAFLILAVNVVWQVIQVFQGPGFGTVLGVLVAVALVGHMLTSRRQAQIVQDRVIRLEMRRRLEHLLPVERHGDIARLALPQLIALRFASDAELPTLLAATLADSLTPTAIKQRVTAWQGDRMRV